MTARLALLATGLLLPALAVAQAIDTVRSRADFELRTRWGKKVQGQFPTVRGEIETLADGRRRVRLRMATGDMVVHGSERYTRIARGPEMFDSARHPWVEFVSEPFPAALARAGGALDGRLSMHGVERHERFTLAPAGCDRPGHDCEVLAQGRVSRDDYGLDGWQWAVADRVRFRLHVRFADH